MTAKQVFFRHSAATALLLLNAGIAQAETLQGALAKAYRSNPTLTGTRAQQRATDENVPIRKADGRPNIGTTTEYQELLVKPARSFLAPDRSLVGTATVNVPIYQGGAVRNGVKAAQVRVQAGQANLRGT